MTTREAQALLKEVIEEFSGFSVRGKLLLKVPLEKLLRGVYLARSVDKELFYAEVLVMPLCVPTDYLHFNFGFRLRNRAKEEGCSLGMPSLALELSKALENQALPYFARYDSLLSFARIETSKDLRNPHTPRAIAYALAREGQGDEAIVMIDQLLSQLNVAVQWEKEMFEQSSALKKELMENPEEAQRRLQEEELATVKKLKLENFFQSSQ